VDEAGLAGGTSPLEEKHKQNVHHVRIGSKSTSQHIVYNLNAQANEVCSEGLDIDGTFAV
jgi:hypothetical protein